MARTDAYLRFVRQSGIGAVVVLGAFVSAVSSAGELHANLGVVSDYVVHGLSRTLAEPAVQVELSVSNDLGWTAGLWGSSVNLNTGPGPSAEYAIFAGRSRRIGVDLSLEARLARYIVPGDPAAFSYDYTEMRVALAYRDTLELAIAVSPDYSVSSSYGWSQERAAVWSELAVHYPLGPRWTLTGGVGYADLTDHVDKGYRYYSAGVQWNRDRLAASAGYIGASRTATRLFGDSQAGDRWVAGVVLRMR